MKKLFQKRPLNGQREFEIVKQRYLLVTHRSLRGRISRYQLDLLALDPNGPQLVQFAWHWLIAGVVIGLISYVSGLLHSWPQDLSWQNSLYAMAWLGATCTIILVVLFIYRSSFEKNYTTRHSNIPLVRLFSNKPNREQFRQFTEQLETLITELSEHYTLPVSDQLAGEMKMLRRLAQEKIMTVEAYEKAKNELFRLSDKHT